MIVAPFSYDPKGAIVLTGDGPDLVAVSAINDEPIWKASVDSVLVGLGVRDEEVVSCDADGRVIWWRRFNGERLREVDLSQPVSALCSVSPGLWALLCPAGVLWMNDQGDYNLTRVSDVAHLAISADGAHYALSFTDGRLELRVQRTDEVVASLSTGFSGGPLLWTGAKALVVASGHELFFYKQTRLVVEQTDEDEPPAPPVYEWRREAQFTAAKPIQTLALSHDGVSLALGFESSVEIILTQGQRSLGQARLNRAVTALSFGPDAWLGVGHESCTATRLELAQGVVGKTRAGLGRVPEQWTVEASIDWAAYRGAMQKSKAGDQSIASKVQLPSFWSGDDGTPGKKGRSPLLWAGLGCGLISVCCGCCGCSGLLGSLW